MYVRNDNTCPYCGTTGVNMFLRDKWQPLAFVVLSSDVKESFLQGNFSMYAECLDCGVKGSVIWSEKVVRTFLMDFARESPWFQPTSSCRKWGLKRKISWSLLADKLVSAFTYEDRCWSLEVYNRLLQVDVSLADFCSDIQSIHLMIDRKSVV